MAENSLNLLSLLGLGGAFGLFAGIYTAGKRFATHLSDFANTLDLVLRDPRNADLAALIEKARVIEKDASSLLGMLKQIFKKG